MFRGLQFTCDSMKSKADPPLSRQDSSDTSILLFSFVTALAVFLAAILLQWLVYIDWLHSNAPLRLTGSVLAGALTFGFVVRSRSAAREQRVEMLRRFETIAEMNDRIRNALQVIECVTYAANPLATEPVRDAVNIIEAVLHEAHGDTSRFAGRTSCGRDDSGVLTRAESAKQPVALGSPKK